jgi:hypothetical protein
MATIGVSSIEEDKKTTSRKDDTDHSSTYFATSEGWKGQQDGDIDTDLFYLEPENAPENIQLPELPHTTYRTLHQQKPAASFFITESLQTSQFPTPQIGRSRSSSYRPDEVGMRRTDSDLSELLNINFEGISLLQQLVARAKANMYKDSAIDEEPLEIVLESAAETAGTDSRKKKAGKKKKKVKGKKRKSKRESRNVPPENIVTEDDPDEEQHTDSGESESELSSCAESINLEPDLVDARIAELKASLLAPPPFVDLASNQQLQVVNREEDQLSSTVIVSEPIVTVALVQPAPIWIQIAMIGIAQFEKTVVFLQRYNSSLRFRKKKTLIGSLLQLDA